MKDMLNQRKTYVQAIKIKHQPEGEGDLVRRKRKAIILSIEDKLQQELEEKEELLKKIRFEFEALSQKKIDEVKEQAMFELEKMTKALNDDLAHSWEEKQRAVDEKKKEVKRLKIEEKEKKQKEKKQNKEERRKNKQDLTNQQISTK